MNAELMADLAAQELIDSNIVNANQEALSNALYSMITKIVRDCGGIVLYTSQEQSCKIAVQDMYKYFGIKDS